MISKMYQSIYLAVTTAYLNLVISFVSVMILLIFMFQTETNNYYANHVVLEQALNSVEYKVCVGIFVLTPLPMLFDLFLDKLVESHDTNKNYWFARVIVGVSTLVVGYLLSHLEWLSLILSKRMSQCGYLTHVCLNDANGQNNVLVVKCFVLVFGCFKAMLIGSVNFCLCETNSELFSVTRTSLVTFFVTLCIVLRKYGDPNDTSVYYMQISLYYLSLVFAVVTLTYWISALVYKLKSIGWKVDHDVYMGLLFLTSNLFETIFAFIVFIWDGRFDGEIRFMTLNGVVSVLYIYYVPILILTMIPGRIARLDAVAAKDKLLDSKKSYVRYISHELRTPLNTVFLGLRYLFNSFNTKELESEGNSTYSISSKSNVEININNALQSLKAYDNETESGSSESSLMSASSVSTQPQTQTQTQDNQNSASLIESQPSKEDDKSQDEDRKQTVIDISHACEVALDVLNELLMYDKLESGIAVLNPEEVNVQSLLLNTIAMFNVQFKDKKIQLSIFNHTEPFWASNGETGDSHESEEVQEIKESSMPVEGHTTSLTDTASVTILGEAECSLSSENQTENIVSSSLKKSFSSSNFFPPIQFKKHTSGSNTPSTKSSKSLQSTVHLANNSLDSTKARLSTLTNKVIEKEFSDSNSTTITKESNKKSTFCILTTDPKFPVSDSDVIGVDKNKMEQVLRNLISNAIKFTPTNGHISVHFQFIVPQSSQQTMQQQQQQTQKDKDEKQAGYFMLQVTDDGAGISPENQKKLFKEIVQFNPEKLQNGGGSGLGLWITRGIVDLHKGKISVFSEGEGHGTTFTLLLPMTRSKAVTAASAGATTTTFNTAGSTPIKCLQQQQTHHAASKVLTPNDTKKKQNHSKLSAAASHAPTRSEPPQSTSLNQRSINHSSANNNILNSPERETLTSKRLTIEKVGSSNALTALSLLTPASSKTIATADNYNKVSHNNNNNNNSVSKDKQSSVLRILIVDDSISNRKMLCRALRLEMSTLAAGGVCLITEEAENGQICVDMVTELASKSSLNKNDVENAASLKTKTKVDEYDAILMDSNMPVLSGPAASQVLRQRGYTGLIYGITGDALPSDLESYKLKGANEVFVKPVDTSVLKKHFLQILQSKYM